MPRQVTTSGAAAKAGTNDSSEQAGSLARKLQEFLEPVLQSLDELLDRRLVKTFAETIGAILRFRDTTRGLLLSELGAWLTTPEHAPAGTKRLSNLLRSTKWSATVLGELLWRRAEAHATALRQKAEPILAAWDHSVIEKPESIALEGLCAVRSQKARRLGRPRAGFSYRPYPKVVVPGLNWLGLLVLGLSGAPTLAAMRWWTTHGERASTALEHQRSSLRQVLQRLGADVIHLFDRGFAGGPWLAALSAEQHEGRRARFITRWQKRYKLMRLDGPLIKCSRLLMGKRAWGCRWITRESGQRSKMYLTAVELAHPEYGGRLWLVRCRIGKAREPWYLLTNEPVTNLKQALAVARAYLRRWQIELCWRFNKSELAMQSPRLWSWDNRLKLLMMVAICYSFLLSLLVPDEREQRSWLLRYWAHRTGSRCQHAIQPLYRLRAALSRLWLAFAPLFGWPMPQTPG
jgi:hypothetical protein